MSTHLRGKIFVILIIVILFNTLFTSVSSISQKKYFDNYNFSDDQTINETDFKLDYSILNFNKKVRNSNQIEWYEETTCYINDVIRYNITLQYYGDYILYNIKISDIFPSNLIYMGNANPKETQISGNQIIWNLSNIQLSKNESLYIEYDAKISNVGDYTNLANLIARECSGITVNYNDSANVSSIPYPLKVDANGPYTGNTGEQISFISKIEGGIPPYKCKWEFGDKNFSDNCNPVHSYLKSGIYKVNLTVEDALGTKATDSTTATIYDITPPYIEIIKPKEKFLYINNLIRRPSISMTRIVGPILIKTKTYDDEGINKVEFYLDEELKFVDTSSPYQWLWLRDPIRPILSNKHTLKVIAYDTSNNTNTSELNLRRDHIYPILIIGLLKSIHDRNNDHDRNYPIINFLKQKIKDIVLFIKNLIENLDKKGFHPIRNHPLLSIATIALIFYTIINNSDNSEPNDSNSNPPTNNPPKAKANGPYEGYVNETLYVDASNSTDSDGEITSYTWDFGDGTIKYGKKASHIYLLPGVYTLILTVTDDSGDSKSDVTTVNIQYNSNKLNNTKSNESENSSLMIPIIGSGVFITLLVSIYLLNRRKLI